MEESLCLVAKFTSNNDGLIIFDTDRLIIQLGFEGTTEQLVNELQKYFCLASLPGNVVQCSSAIGGGGYYWKLDGFSKCSTVEFLQSVQVRRTVEAKPCKKRKTNIAPKRSSKPREKSSKKTMLTKNVLTLDVSDEKKERFSRYLSVASDLETLMGINSLNDRTNIILSQLTEETVDDMDTLLLKAILFFSTEVNRFRQVLKISSSSKHELEQFREKFITDYEKSFLAYTINLLKKYECTFEECLGNNVVSYPFTDAQKEEEIKQFLIQYIPRLNSLETYANNVYKLFMLDKEKTVISVHVTNMNSRFLRPDLPRLEYNEVFLKHLQHKSCSCTISPYCQQYSSVFSEVYQKSLLCETMQQTGHCISECCIWLLHFYQEHSFSCTDESCHVPGCISRKKRHQVTCQSTSCKYKCCSFQAKRKLESIFFLNDGDGDDDDDGDDNGQLFPIDEPMKNSKDNFSIFFKKS